MNELRFAQRRLLPFVGLSVVFAATVVPGGVRRAEACGGLFCNRPPPDPFAPLPIAQTGENIVFSVSTTPTGGTTIEAHIQIFYSGPADKFSWIVPVDAQPTIGVGSDRTFTTVAGLTRPTFTTEWKTEGKCKPDRNYPGPQPGNPSGAGTGGSGGGVQPPGVQVAFRGAVGPFDAAVIKSASNVELVKWLTDNGYFVADDAVAIIDEYVAENKFFVALKLLNCKDVLSIQPVVLKFPGTEPCVPLRLTAIAAMKDLPVNMWVLGASRTVPTNYHEIKLNEARIDWVGGGGNYTDLVKQAANEAGGNAFIAEYAGTSNIMRGQLWPSGQINLARLRLEKTPPTYLQTLVQQGLTMFSQTLGLLRQFIPLPKRLADMGVTETEFYNNNQFYWDNYQADFAPFDPELLTNEIDKAVVTPLREGQALFDGQPYLTRLATFISPEEMTKDPLFTFNSELPNISNIHKATANIMCGNEEYTSCEAPVRVDIEGGPSVWLRRDPKNPCFGPFERGTLDDMPALGVAYQREEVGEGQKVVDNGAAISKALSAHNAAVSHAGGCGCSAAGGPIAAGAGLAMLLAFVLVRRARR